MVVLVTCKNEEDPVKNEGARDGILTKFKLVHAFIVVLFICKYEGDPFKIESTREVATFLPL